MKEDRIKLSKKLEDLKEKEEKRKQKREFKLEARRKGNFNSDGIIAESESSTDEIE
jgi:hypothetical protein